MASSEKTSFVQLSQFKTGDVAKWQEDYNSDMRKVDSAMADVVEGELRRIDGEITCSVLNEVSVGTVVPQTVPAGEALVYYVSVISGVLNGVPTDFLENGTGKVSVTPNPNSLSATSLIFSVADRNGGPNLTYEIDMTSLIQMDDNATYDMDLSPFGTVTLKNGDTELGTAPGRVIRGLGNYLNSLTPGLKVETVTQYKVGIEAVNTGSYFQEYQHVFNSSENSHSFIAMAKQITQVLPEASLLDGATLITGGEFLPVPDNWMEQGIGKVTFNLNAFPTVSTVTIKGRDESILSQDVNPMGTWPPAPGNQAILYLSFSGSFGFVNLNLLGVETITSDQHQQFLEEVSNYLNSLSVGLSLQIAPLQTVDVGRFTFSGATFDPATQQLKVEGNVFSSSSVFGSILASAGRLTQGQDSLFLINGPSISFL